MEIELIIITLVLLIVFTIQLGFFRSTRGKIKVLKTIFSGKAEDNYSIIVSYNNEIVLSQKDLDLDSSNDVRTDINDSINDYFRKKKDDATDNLIIEDIVNGKCDIIEESINTQVPIPLYLGLLGTLFCVLIGVISILLRGDFVNNPDAMSDTLSGLWIGVACAMCTSIAGVIFNICGSNSLKKAREIKEEGKRDFIEWLKTELTLQMPTDFTSALSVLTKNLSKFNKAFSSNTKELRDTLEKINITSISQTKLLKQVDDLNIGEVTNANYELVEKLSSCSGEIGKLGDYFKNVTDYLNAVNALNQKLDTYERRTQIIEQAGIFFAKNEKWLSDNINSATDETKTALDCFKTTISTSFTNIGNEFNSQILSFKQTAEQQLQSYKNSVTPLTDSIQKTFKTYNELIEDQQKKVFDGIDEYKKKLLKQIDEAISSISGIPQSSDPNLMKSISEINVSMKTITELLKSNDANLKTRFESGEDVDVKKKIITNNILPIVRDVSIVFCMVAVILFLFCVI
jgi:tetratricopeptide (TPR) repeat protein